MSARLNEVANDEQSGKDRETFPTGVSVQNGLDVGHGSVMCDPDDLPVQLSVALTDGGSDTIEQAAVSQRYSAEAHGFSRAEEARKLRKTTHRLQHCRLPNVVKNTNKEW